MTYCQDEYDEENEEEGQANWDLDIDENADFDFVWDLREWKMKEHEWSKMKWIRKWLVYCYCMQIRLTVRERKIEVVIC